MNGNIYRRFEMALALLALVLLVTACGHGRNVGAGLAPTGVSSGVGAPLAAPGQGRASTAPTIPLADVLKQIDAYPAPKGVDAARFAALKAELRKLLIARAAGSKTISVAPAGSLNQVTDLSAAANATATQATLAWTEVLPGDYDNDGEVFITDILPIALYFGEDATTGADDAHRLVVGDADPVINEGDLAALAQNYGSHLEGYEVWRGHWNGTSTDWETTPRPNPNPSDPSWSADRPSPPPVSARPSYTYVDDISGLTDKANVRYKVTAYGDGAAGAESSEATMPPPPAYSISGTVTQSGVGFGGVLLTLTPGGLNATTQTDGTYSIAGVISGSYVLTPTKYGYWFSPLTWNVTVAGADVTGQDFTVVHGGLATSPWPKFRMNEANTGQSTHVGAQTNSVKWSHTLSNDLESSPAILFDGSICVGCEDGTVSALNALDGSLRWQRTLAGGVGSSPAVDYDGIIYVGSYDKNVYAIQPADGSLKWTYLTGGAIHSSPAIGPDGVIYIGSDDYNVYALNASDGSLRWQHATAGNVRTCPAIGADGTVYVGSADGNFYALNPLDGSLRWTAGIGQPVLSSAAIGADGTIFVGAGPATGGGPGGVYALNPSDGSVKWSLSTDSVLGSPAIGADGTVYVPCVDGTVRALSPADGSVIWKSATLSGAVRSSPSLGADGTIYVGSEGSSQNFWALKAADGSVLWSYTTGWSVNASPAIAADGTIYAASTDYKLYAFGTAPVTHSVSGTVTLSSAGVEGVLMSLSPGGYTASTLADGTYVITGVPDGTYTLLATKAGYGFVPQHRNVAVNGADLPGQDFAAVLTGLASTPWPKFRADARNTGQSAYVGAQTGTLKWSKMIAVANYVESSAAVGADGTVYIGSDDGNLYALNPTDGSVKWQYATSGMVQSGPALTADGSVVFGSFDGGIYGLSLADGSFEWKITHGAFGSSPTVNSDGTVYIGCYNFYIYGTNPFSPTGWYIQDTGNPVRSSPAMDQNGNIYIGSEDGNVYAIPPHIGGGFTWIRATGGPVDSSPAVGADGTIYVGSGDGKVYALNPGDGSVKWTHTTGGPVWSSPGVAADGTVYVGSDDGKVYALNSADGSEKWTFTTAAAVKSSLAIGADGTVYIGSDDQSVYALRPADGAVLWSYATGGVVESSPSIAADGTVYVGSFDGNLYAFGP